MTSAAVDGEVFGISGLPPVTTTTTATMMHQRAEPAEDVAQALEQPALGRQQQDHRRERYRLERDHEADEE